MWWLVGTTDKMKDGTDSGFAHGKKNVSDLSDGVWRVFSGVAGNWEDCSSIVIDYDSTPALLVSLRELWDLCKNSKVFTDTLGDGTTAYQTSKLLELAAVAKRVHAKDAQHPPSVGSAGAPSGNIALPKGNERERAARTPPPLESQTAVFSADAIPGFTITPAMSSGGHLQTTITGAYVKTSQVKNGMPVYEKVQHQFERDVQVICFWFTKGNHWAVSQTKAPTEEDEGQSLEDGAFWATPSTAYVDFTKKQQWHLWDGEFWATSSPTITPVGGGALHAAQRQHLVEVIESSLIGITLIKFFQNNEMYTKLADSLLTTAKQMAGHLESWIGTTYGSYCTTGELSTYLATYPELSKRIRSQKAKGLEMFVNKFPLKFKWQSGLPPAIQLVSDKWHAVARTPGGSKGDAAAAVDQSAAVEDSFCPICYDELVISAVGPCNHVCCHICALRLRKFDKMPNRSEEGWPCIQCRIPLLEITLSTDVQAKYSTQGTHPLQQYDVMCSSQEALLAARNVLKIFCRICQKEDFSSEKQLVRHVRKKHGMTYCELCCANVNHFISTEQILYSDESALSTHIDNSHKKCAFCNIHYFDDDALLDHLRQAHEQCKLCEDAGKPFVYFTDYSSMEEHYKVDHFLCCEEACRDQSSHKMYFVFSTKSGLQQHQNEQHISNHTPLQGERWRVQSSRAPLRVASAGSLSVATSAVEYRTDASDKSMDWFN